MNLCTADPEARSFAADILEDDLRRMTALPGNFYNFHPGSHVGQGLEAGIDYIAQALKQALRHSYPVTVLLETMAGKGSEIGGRFEEIRMILDAVGSEHVGVCLDTCHVYDGGYDIVGDLDGVLAEFDRVIGLNRLKALTSAPDIKERLPYARYKTEIPHQASFCATGNNRHFLTDDTGNRRWIPFFIHSIPAPFEHPLPHEGMYAQALHLIRTGYRHVLDDEENNLLEKHNRDFEAPNLEMEFVNMFFRKPHYGELCEFVSTASILKEIHLHYRQRLSPARICHAMERMGFHYTRNGNQRGFQAVRISIEEHKKIKYTDTPDIFDQSAEKPAPE